MNTKNDLWGIHHIVDEKNQIVYVKCESATTAMGIGVLLKKYYPGYVGKLVTFEYLEKLRGQLEN
jgi:hypothetical protein